MTGAVSRSAPGSPGRRDRWRRQAETHAAVAVLSLGVVALAWAATRLVGSWWATSPALVAAAVAVAAVLSLLRAAVPGWRAVRLSLSVLGVAVLAVPGWWSAAAIASHRVPDSTLAWLTSVLAVTAHLPLVAAFSLLPLLCLRYLGAGSSRRAVGVVLALTGATWLLFALYFDDFAPPLRASAPLESPAGEVVGAGLHAVLLGTVLLGPAATLLAAGRADAPGAGRRLRTVGLASLAGAVLVMVCGAVAGVGPTSLSPGSAATFLCLTAFAAVLAVAHGAVRALRLPASTGPPSAAGDGTTPSLVPAGGTPGDPPSPRQPEVLAADAATLTEVARRDGDGPPDPGCAPGLRQLTPREHEVLELLALGLSNAGIAARLVVSQRTVDAHLRAVFTKLDLPDGPDSNRRVLAARALSATRSTS